MIGRNAILNPNPEAGQIYLASQLAGIYADMANREPIQAKTMEALKTTWLPGYQARVIPNTQLIEIAVTDTNPERARIVADELARQLMVLVSTRPRIRSQMFLSSIMPASATFRLPGGRNQAVLDHSAPWNPFPRKAPEAFAQRRPREFGPSEQARPAASPIFHIVFHICGKLRSRTSHDDAPSGAWEELGRQVNVPQKPDAGQRFSGGRFDSGRSRPVTLKIRHLIERESRDSRTGPEHEAHVSAE